MSNELQKAVTAKPPMWTDDEKRIIRSQFFPPNATAQEMQYCIKVAESLGLNPILKQIWFVPRRAKDPATGQYVEKIEPMAGRDSFLTLAHRSGKFAGIKSWCEVKDYNVLVNGQWETKKDLYGIAEVRRTDTSEVYKVEVAYSEYVQTTRDGNPTKFWKEKSETMIKKVAESQVLRKAFNISGLYDEAEIREEREIEATVVPSAKISIDKEAEAFKQAMIELGKCSTVAELEVVSENYSREILGHKFNAFDQEYLCAVDAIANKAIETQDQDFGTEFEQSTEVK